MRTNRFYRPVVYLLAGAIFGFFGPASEVFVDQAAAQSRPRQAATEARAGTYVDELVAQAKRLLGEEPRDPAKAAILLAEAAKADNPEAMVLLGRLYAAGDGVTADFDEAKSWIERAIALEGAALDLAWMALGDLYRTADEAHQDLARAVEAYQKSVDLGRADALVSLATMIANGEGVEADLDRAEQLLLRATEQEVDGAAAGWASLGDLYRDSGREDGPARAVAAYQRAVDLGDTTVLVGLARMVGAGEGVAPDFERARKLLEAAIALKNASEAEAWAVLGDLYRDSAEAYRNLAEAAAAYQQAVDLGSNEVLISLAEILAEGAPDVPADFERARALLEKASALGGREAVAAWRALGNLYRNADAEHADMSKAAAAYEHAAAAGDVVAKIHLARILGSGRGVPVNFDRAKSLLEQAIAAGGGTAAWAYATLGDLLRNAEEAHRDLAAAADAYQHAADLGDTGSMLNLAALLGAGNGVPRDFNKAKALLEKAIAAGDDNRVWAWIALGGLYTNAEPGYRDHAKAIEAYQAALDVEENGVAWYALGDLYGSGDPAIRDLTKAYEAYQKAAELGETGALIDHALLLPAAAFDEAKALLDQAIVKGDRSLGRAWVALGDLYRNADAEHRDLAKAAEAYKVAAEAGNTPGMIKFARLVGWGEGVEPDFDLAEDLLERAVAAGGGTQTWAWGTLGDLYRYANPERSDPMKAIGAYGHAADGGDVAAMVKLGEILGRGEGVPVNFAEAKTWLEKAIAAGGDDIRSWAWATLGDLNAAEGPNRNMTEAVKAFQAAADLGDTGSMIALAEILGTGDGVPKDFDRARQLLEKAIAVNDRSAASAWAILGDLYRAATDVERNMTRAADAYLQAANRGHVSSMIKLARIVGWGNGVPANFEFARAQLEKAIAAGGGTAAWAWSTLGDLYRANEANRDLAKAAEAYGQAAELGDTGAMINLASLLTSGEKPDFEAARALLEKAAAADDDNSVWAWAMLGNIYAELDTENLDLAKAADAYRKAAARGDTGSMVALAALLAVGNGVLANPPEAINLLKRAIAADDENAGAAWLALGEIHVRGPKPDVAAALEAYREAAKRGETLAIIRLASMTGSGEGLAPDFDTARALLLRVIGADDEQSALAWTALGNLYRQAEPPNRDLASAVQAYEKGVAGGDVGAMVQLARMLGLGEGTEADFPRAKSLLDEAVESGKAVDPVAIWIAYGDIYRFGPGRYANLNTALGYYEKAAAAGSAAANLAAAELESTARSSRRIPSMIGHYRNAAEGLGAGEVAKVLYRLEPASLFFTVQAFLAYLNPGSVVADGVYGAKTAAAVGAFCTEKGLFCDGTIVTFDFLEALIAAVAAREEVAGG